MTRIAIDIKNIVGIDVAVNHGEGFDDYRHNEAAILLIGYYENGRWMYEMLTGGHRYNSAVAAGYETIDAFVIDADKVDFDENPRDYLWDLNDEADIIKALGEENFD